MTDPAASSAPPAPPHAPPDPTVPDPTRPADGPPRTDLLAAARSLRRSRSNRVVAGVLGGIAPRLGVDPLLLRIVVAVLALFGVGIGLYAVAWLLIPAEGEPGSVGQQALGRGRPARAGTVVLALVLLLVALFALSATGFDGGWAAPPLLVLAVVGVVLLLRRAPDRPANAALPPPSGTAPAPWTGAAPGTTAAWTEGGAAAAPGWTGGDLPPLAPDPPGLPPAPRPRRPRSRLLPLTLSAALVAVGVLAVVDVTVADVPWGGYWALALAVVGAGLVLGAWAGRSRGLVAVGVVLALGAGASLMDIDDGDSDFRRTSERITAVPAGGLRIDPPNGEATYDLRGLQLAGQDREVEVDQGIGELVLLLPSGMDVDVTAEAGLGELSVLGRTESGPGSELTLQDLGTDGLGGGTLRLDVSTGVGAVEVRRG